MPASIALLMLSAALLLSGCCTAVGCSNTVTFQLGAAGQHFGIDEPVLVRACVGAQCAEETVTNTAPGSSSSTGTSLSLGSGLLSFTFANAVTGAQNVSLELKKNGSVVFSDQRDVTLVGFSPNDGVCGPTCQQATISL